MTSGWKFFRSDVTLSVQIHLAKSCVPLYTEGILEYRIQEKAGVIYG